MLITCPPITAAQSARLRDFYAPPPTMRKLSEQLAAANMPAMRKLSEQLAAAANMPAMRKLSEQLAAANMPAMRKLSEQLAATANMPAMRKLSEQLAATANMPAMRKLSEQLAAQSARLRDFYTPPSVLNFLQQQLAVTTRQRQIDESITVIRIRNFFPCDYPWQTDHAGNHCGRRAASIRPGGRLGGSGL